MKRSLTGGITGIEIAIIVLLIGGGWGWIWNIVKIVHAISDPITGMFILRCVGVFVAPLGAIIGYF